jgi:hypothetical protein
MQLDDPKTLTWVKRELQVAGLGLTRNESIRLATGLQRLQHRRQLRRAA